MENHKTIKLIKESEYLPKIPKSFGKILNMLLDPCEYHMDACIEEFSKFPELERALIDFLNHNTSLNREILDIRDATVYLGARIAKLIAIAHITRLLLPGRKGRANVFNTSKYWKHCIGTSIASYMIAAETGLSHKDKMYTYGLIHDIGVAVLDICLPEHLDKINILQNKGVHQIAAEKLVLGGITHSEIGMWLCKEWGLPDEIAEITGFHHYPFLCKNHEIEVKIMHLADSISTNYYENLLGNETTFIYSEKTMEFLGVTKEFVDEIIKRLPKEVERVERIMK